MWPSFGSFVCSSSVIYQHFADYISSRVAMGREEIGGGVAFEIGARKVPGANPGHLIFGRMPG